ncbi:toxin glutamine deamidase domain-containing protein [Streptomyces sp. Ru72]|uniref:toxin glutamine deamidase domain-containing protein n=1 Tax=Streptomyces sp. Ru72 TaxID=2080747 RepID=UPI000CDE0B95|nr:hypothetical protein C3488_26170 [Streptomyces sp. Ru72]
MPGCPSWSATSSEPCRWGRLTRCASPRSGPSCAPPPAAVRRSGGGRRRGGRFADARRDIANTLQQAGHGSAAIVQVDWPGGGGHAFDAVNHHGHVLARRAPGEGSAAGRGCAQRRHAPLPWGTCQSLDVSARRER